MHYDCIYTFATWVTLKNESNPESVIKSKQAAALKENKNIINTT